MKSMVLAALVLASAVAAHAQTPYAGMRARDIKALSEQQVVLDALLHKQPPAFRRECEALAHD